MALSTVDYQQANLKAIPFVMMFKEYREKVMYGIELEQEMNWAYEAHDTEAMFSIASELGVISIQIQLLQAEANRRDEEDGLFSEEEVREVEAALFEELLAAMFK